MNWRSTPKFAGGSFAYKPVSHDRLSAVFVRHFNYLRLRQCRSDRQSHNRLKSLKRPVFKFKGLNLRRLFKSSQGRGYWSSYAEEGCLTFTIRFTIMFFSVAAFLLLSTKWIWVTKACTVKVVSLRTSRFQGIYLCQRASKAMERY